MASVAVPRRRRWPWVVAAAVLVLAVLVVVAEFVARDLVQRIVREQIVEVLALPADQEIDVEVPGLVLPQVIAGELNELRVASDDVALDVFAGDVAVRAEQVRFRGEVSLGQARATVRMDEEQLRGLLGTVEGFPAESVGLDAPNVTATTELSFLGATVPIGLALTPSAADGDLVLTPDALRLGDAEITAQQLRDRFGALADAVARDWSVCIAEYLPAGVVLASAEVRASSVVADFDIDGRIVHDAALQEPGFCG